MKHVLIGALALVWTNSAHADVYNYICKSQGRRFPLKVDDTRNTLEWDRSVYRIKELEDCGFQGWRAEKDGTSFDFCMSNRGDADFKLNGSSIQCNLTPR